MCTIYSFVLLPILLKKDIRPGILDPLWPHIIGLTSDTHNVRVYRSQILEEGWKEGSKESIKFLSSPIHLEDNARLVIWAGLNCKPG